MAKPTLFIGQFIHSMGLDDLEVVPKGYIAVQDGKVREIDLCTTTNIELHVARDILIYLTNILIKKSAHSYCLNELIV